MRAAALLLLCEPAALSGVMPSVPGQSGSRPGQYVFLGMAPLSAAALLLLNACLVYNADYACVPVANNPHGGVSVRSCAWLDDDAGGAE